MIIKYFGLAKQNIFSYLKSASSSTSRAFFFIILRNSGKSMVPWILDNFEQSVCFSYLPFPSTSTSSTKLRSSSSVGFCPIALMTPSSSSEEIVPLPSWNNFFSMIISQRQAQQLLIPTYTCYTVYLTEFHSPYQMHRMLLSARHSPSLLSLKTLSLPLICLLHRMK